MLTQCSQVNSSANKPRSSASITNDALRLLIVNFFIVNALTLKCACLSMKRKRKKGEGDEICMIYSHLAQRRASICISKCLDIGAISSYDCNPRNYDFLVSRKRQIDSDEHVVNCCPREKVNSTLMHLQTFFKYVKSPSIDILIRLSNIALLQKYE